MGKYLEFMVEIAKVQSTVASNRTEGIFTSETRLDTLMKETYYDVLQESSQGWHTEINTYMKSFRAFN
jgi:hypothetical protein